MGLAPVENMDAQTGAPLTSRPKIPDTVTAPPAMTTRTRPPSAQTATAAKVSPGVKVTQTNNVAVVKDTQTKTSPAVKDAQTKTTPAAKGMLVRAHRVIRRRGVDAIDDEEHEVFMIPARW